MIADRLGYFGGTVKFAIRCSGSAWFSDDHLLCVRWYLRFQVSYREMAEIAWELGILVAPSTILRWAIRYAAEFERCWRVFEQPVGRRAPGETVKRGILNSDKKIHFF
jgi:hypothetical protein